MKSFFFRWKRCLFVITIVTIGAAVLFADGLLRWGVLRSNYVLFHLGILFGGNLRIIDDHGRSLLFHSFGSDDVEILRELFRAGLDPNLKDNDGETSFHLQVADHFSVTSFGVITGPKEIGNLEVLTLFLECGANVNLKDRWGNTILSRAIHPKINVASFELLLKNGANPVEPNLSGITPLDKLLEMSVSDAKAALKQQQLTNILKQYLQSRKSVGEP